MMAALVVMRMPIEQGNRRRERGRERAQRKDLLESRMRGYCSGMAKKLLEREKQEERERIYFFLLFFTPGRTTRAMLGEQGIEWKINVSILQKNEEEEEEGEEEEEKRQGKRSIGLVLIIEWSSHTHVHTDWPSVLQPIFSFPMNDSKRPTTTTRLVRGSYPAEEKIKGKDLSRRQTRRQAIVCLPLLCSECIIDEKMIKKEILFI